MSLQACTTSSQKATIDGYLYRPHGKFSTTYGLSIVSSGDGLLLKGGCAVECSVSLKKGTLDGQDITYIQKDYPRGFEAFHRELYMYSHDKLLRPLQGMTVPFVIGAYMLSEGCPAIVMEPLDSCAWSGADSTAGEPVKRNIIQAYTQLHSRGVLHGGVKSQNIIFNAKCDVYLVNFSAAATLDDHTASGVRRCTQADLDEEARSVESLLNSPPPNETFSHHFEIPTDMRSPQWTDNSNAQTPSLSLPYSNLTQSAPRQHSSPESHSPSPPASGYVSPLTVSTRAAGMQRSGFDCVSVSDQSPQQHSYSLPQRKSSPRPKRVVSHPDTEDYWMWSQTLRTPQLSRENREALQVEAWQDDDEETIVRLDAPDSPPHLTYQEPPPRPAEDAPTADEATNFETFIIITSPTGDNCVYGVSAEMAARIQRDLLFAKAKPLSFDNPSVASHKRKAALPHAEQPPQKRVPPPGNTCSLQNHSPEGQAIPMVGV
ncbi:hypothetical protein PHLGIDRAFT_21610 [Phlebiopsis gigantea 11061_1 CR5-6]|uniref:Protein kinase domain-containing protein n=1 Tax=Phlebiopsis gigantea (strain 11061_1 CR5-6) TaxID=745531 RepID=A0A0C3PUM7_PHLG1|nr:hypothetical protein PHLGIDRAFT_21610 [Phlebiopsis gigantea 11061_1 CR5-6]